eukprot:m.138058 g.138058  ORF g.138058 m.138058 type:complete len:455 (-) comp16064_c0_seq1:190-1554(-)
MTCTAPPLSFGSSEDGFATQQACNRLSWITLCVKELVAIQAILAAHWATLAHAIEHRTTAPIEVSFKGNSRQTKHRLLLKDIDGKKVPIGLPHSTPAAASHHLNMDAVSVVDPNGDGVHVVSNGGALPVQLLVEILAKVCRVDLSSLQAHCLASVADRTTCPGNGDWIDGLVVEREAEAEEEPELVRLIDTFTALHPTAQSRFTCWDQYKNKRYENKGARIDYILVDQQLQHVLTTAWQPAACQLDQEQCPPCLQSRLERTETGKNPPTCLVGSQSQRCVWSDPAALAATIAQGRWKPAPFDGSGINEGQPKDYMYQFQTPHTGMVYTPPTYSDHIGVSTVLKLQIGPVSLASDAATRRARPYLSQARISDFVKRPSGARAEGESASTSGHAQMFAAFKTKQAARTTSRTTVVKPTSKAKGKGTKPAKSAKRGTTNKQRGSSKTPKLLSLFQPK